MNKKSVKIGITSQEQSKATDYKSVDCGNSEHCEGVLAAVGAFYRCRKQGKGHAHKRSGTEAARRKSKAAHRRSGSLSAIHAAGSTQRATTQAHGHADGLQGTQTGTSKTGSLHKPITPKRSGMDYIINTDTKKLPMGVNP